MEPLEAVAAAAVAAMGMQSGETSSLPSPPSIKRPHPYLSSSGEDADDDDDASDDAMITTTDRAMKKRKPSISSVERSSDIGRRVSDIDEERQESSLQSASSQEEAPSVARGVSLPTNNTMFAAAQWLPQQTDEGTNMGQSPANTKVLLDLNSQLLQLVNDLTKKNALLTTEKAFLSEELARCKSDLAKKEEVCQELVETFSKRNKEMSECLSRSQAGLMFLSQNATATRNKLEAKSPPPLPLVIQTSTRHSSTGIASNGREETSNARVTPSSATTDSDPLNGAAARSLASSKLGSSNTTSWTLPEDMKLAEVMRKNQSPKDWEPIAKEVGHKRTAKECRERWTRYLKPGMRKGQWTEQEDALVIEVVTNSEEQPFTRWSDLAQRLPGHTGKQIRDRWVNRLNPAINHLPFSKEEDFLLWKGHQELGKHFVEISTKFFKGSRSENQIKNRWYSAAFKRFIAKIETGQEKEDNGQLHGDE